MKCAIWYGGRDIRLEECELPPLGPEDVRIEVNACGVCGTDVHIIHGAFPLYQPPTIIGHEYSGTVVEVGSNVREIKVGDRVTVDPSGYTCMVCYYCRQGQIHLCPNRAVFRGAYAEYTTVPERVVYKLPEDLPFDLGALTEPISCAVHATGLANPKTGSNALIYGAGTIGLILMQVLLHSGVSRVIVSEPIASRRELAKEMGADVVVDPTKEDLGEAVKDFTKGIGIDLAFEAVGKPALVKDAASHARRGGKVIIVGVSAPGEPTEVVPYDIYYKELTIIGSHIRLFTFPRAINWLTKLNLKPIITHEFPLADTLKAIETTERGEGIKVLVKPKL
jgi:2-desacetyl-2-hydroxyethyl bacteriochlorophyllide A dehydrogenase